jgi:penicillin-binding protein 1B
MRELNLGNNMVSALQERLRDLQQRLQTRFRDFREQHPSIFRGLLYGGIGVAVLSCVLTIYCFTKFSALVDRRMTGGFKHSARIYAAVPEDITPAALALRSENDLTDEEPGLMASVFDGSRARRRVVTFEDIPKVLLNAVLSGEDRVFFKHPGINPKRIAGAFVFNMKKGNSSQGGSTITQQLARSLFLNRAPTLRRKVSEAFIALILEHRLTKEQIFAMYANEIYLGQRDSFAIHGFAEAAKSYFGKDLQDLTLSEAATLAGIIPAPNAYSPVQHPERATARRDLILRIMHDSKSISDAEYEEAKQAQLTIAPKVDPAEGHYLIDFVQEELRRDFPEETLMSGGLKVYTTVDIPLQKAALEAVAQGLILVEAELKKRKRKSDKSVPQAAPQAGLIALDPRTGEIKAMVGGTQYGATQFNRITQAMRQPGSIFKPIVYAAALETGRDGYSHFDLDPFDDEGPAPITPLTILLDEPTVFSSPTAPYRPKNFGGQFSGPVPLRTAFQRSLNIPTVSLAQAVGYNRVVAMARRLGLNPKIQAYPSVALGAFEVTPLEMAGAYTAFANGGKRTEPHAIRKVESENGEVLKTYETEWRTVLSPQLAYLMTHLMQGVVNYGTGGGVRARGFRLPAAGKTGTSRDGWFAGYTKNLLVITWVGYDDGHDLNLEGSRSALPIWVEFMKKAYQIHPVKDPKAMAFNPPPGIEVVNIDSATHRRGDPSCGESFYEAFLWGTAPKASCMDSVDPVLTSDLSVSASR